MDKPIKDDPRLTILLNQELKNRIRNAVYWLSGPPVRLNLSRFGVRALTKFVEELEEKHNHGKPFKQRPVELRAGRPEGT